MRQKQFGIDIRNFSKIKKINSGGFGEVFLAKYNKTGENYAAKVLKYDVNNELGQKKIENEIDIMMNVDHPTIIKYLGYSLLDFQQNRKVTIFMELAKNYSLDEVITKIQKSECPKGYDNTMRQIILIGISCGMKYLHDRGIMHRDLKTNNVLLDENFYPKITDFGTSKYFDKKNSWEKTPYCGTLPYVAPEMILGNKCNWKIDVYSFGILMYIVVTNMHPYPNLVKDDEVVNEFKIHVSRYNYRPEFKVPVQENLKKLIQKCWSTDINERPTFDEIFQKLTNADYFLEDVDERKISRYIEKITQNDGKNTNSSYNSNEIESLKNSNRFLRNENDQLKQQINSNKRSQNENEQLKQQIDLNKSLQNENEHLKQQINSSKRLQNENDQLKQQINSSKRLQNENDQLKQQLNSSKRLQNEIEQLKQQINLNKSLQNEIEQLKQQVNSNKRLQNENEQLKQQININKRLQNEIEDLKQQLNSYKNLQNENEQLKRQINSNRNLQNENEQLKQQININKRLQNENEQLKQQINTNKRLQNENEQLNQQVNSLKKENSIFSKKIEEMSKKLSSFEKEANVSKSNLEKKSNEKAVVAPPKSVDLFSKSSPKIRIKINEISPKESSLPLPTDAIKNENLSSKTSPKSPVSKTPQRSSPQMKVKVDDHISKTPQKQQPQSIIKEEELLSKSSPRPLFIKQHQAMNEKKEEDIASSQIIAKEKIDEELARKLPPLRKTKSDEVSPRFLLNNITFAEFNSYPLQMQQSVISKISKNVRNVRTQQLLTDFLNLLDYLVQFITTPEDSNYVEIQSDNLDQCLGKINNSEGINLLSNAVETLYIHKCLDSIEFYDIIYEFDKLSFEIKYFSKLYMGSYKIISAYEIYKINVFLTGLKRTDNTFKGNQLINSLKIDSSVVSIGDYAFNGCSSLRYVTIPSSVTSIGSNSFEGCTSLTQISVPSSVSSIGMSAFKGCSSLCNVSLPSSISIIQINTFYGCSSLTKIEIPSSVTSIGEYAFFGCSSLSEVSIPSSVISIGDYAFGECSSLEEISIPSSVTSLGKNVFKGCSSLDRIFVPSAFQTTKSLGLHQSINISLS